ncbi:chain length determinant protein EpsF [Methylolobus aquaticus]
MNFNQVFQILLARWKIAAAVFFVTVIAAYGISKLLPKKYTAATTLIVDFQGMDPITGAVINAQQLLPTYMATQVDIIKSHAVAVRVVDATKLTESPELRESYQLATEGRGNIRDWTADLLLNDLAVEPSKQSNVIWISFTAADPEFAAMIANAFGKAFVETNLNFRTVPARQNAAWFEEQLKGLRENLERARGRLSDLEREKGVFAADSQTRDLESARLAELSSKLVLAQADLSEALSHQQELQAARTTGRSLESLPEIISHPLVVNLKTQIAQAEAKLADLSDREGRNHPQYLSAKAELASLREKLKLEIATIVNAINSGVTIAKQREAQLRATIAAEKQKVLELGNKRDELAVLTHEVESAQRSYDEAMQRFSQTRLQGEASQTNIAVLNPAVPPLEPSFPRTLLNVALAGILGSLLGLLAALGLEMLDRRVRGIDDLEFALDLPVLGLLPGNGGARRLGGSKGPTVAALPWGRAGGD